jgi:hypothetical protein
VIARKGIKGYGHELRTVTAEGLPDNNDDYRSMDGREKVSFHDIQWLDYVSSSRIRAMKPSPFSMWPFTRYDKVRSSLHIDVYRYIRENRLYGFSTEFFYNRIQTAVTTVVCSIFLFEAAVWIGRDNSWIKVLSRML